MKSARVVVLLLMGIFLSCYVVGDAHSAAHRSRLEGTWFSGGDRDKVCRIVDRRDGLEARNEHGQTSRLQYDGRGRIRALDWGRATGEIHGDRIDWSNNTYWSRRPHHR